jgi:hypothetical protein
VPKNRRVSFLCSSIEDRNEQLHKLHNHKSSTWVELPLGWTPLKNLRAFEEKCFLIAMLCAMIVYLAIVSFGSAAGLTRLVFFPISIAAILLPTFGLGALRDLLRKRRADRLEQHVLVV